SSLTHLAACQYPPLKAHFEFERRLRATPRSASRRLSRGSLVILAEDLALQSSLFIGVFLGPRHHLIIAVLAVLVAVHFGVAVVAVATQDHVTVLAGAAAVLAKVSPSLEVASSLAASQHAVVLDAPRARKHLVADIAGPPHAGRCCLLRFVAPLADDGAARALHHKRGLLGTPRAPRRLEPPAHCLEFAPARASFKVRGVGERQRRLLVFGTVPAPWPLRARRAVDGLGTCHL
ncbi:unnamed protein product, partial [Pelagomonas calceolata]